MFKIRGKVTKVKEPQDIKNGEFAKREFIVEEQGEKYPQSVMLESFKKGEFIKYAKEEFPAKEGDIVEVEFTLRLNEFEYNGKTIQKNNINAFKIDVVSMAENQPDTQNPTDEEEDLPF